MTILGMVAALAGASLMRQRWLDRSLQTRPDSSPSALTSNEPTHEHQTGQAVKDQDYDQQRRLMVDQQLRRRDITDPVVLRAMANVPRHEFVPSWLRDRAYLDGPLPIGNGQTISQPYIVALMTQLARPERQSRVLDVGTGSGYQAAVLAEIVDKVYSIEIVPELAKAAQQRLHALGYDNVEVRHGDGYRGWPEHAPYDVIIVAAAPDHVPQPLVDQLAPGGRLVIPVGDYAQTLMLVTKDDQGVVQQQRIAPVAFVPMTGSADLDQPNGGDGTPRDSAADAGPRQAKPDQ